MLGTEAVNENNPGIGDEPHVPQLLGDHPVAVAVIEVGVGRELLPLRAGTITDGVARRVGEVVHQEPLLAP